MNSKIKNYVDVLFNDIPNTRKASELKEEILSNLNDHFEAHLSEGKSENQAYTEALSDLGDIDELLESLTPEKELKVKIDEYRKIRAKRVSISVGLFFAALAIFACFFSIGAFVYTGEPVHSIMYILGVIGFLSCFGAGTGILIYTNMSVPQDVEPFLTKQYGNKTNSTGYKIYLSFIEMFWIYITVIYFIISFLTGAWYITWIIWVAAPAIYKSLRIFFDEDKNDSGKE